MSELALLARRPLTWRLALAVALVVALFAFARMPTAPSFRTPTVASPQTTVPKPSALSIPLPALPDTAVTLPIASDEARLSNAEVPIADLHPVAAAPFRFAGDDAARARARDCLALAAWYEAGDDASGERAVVQVILNRVRHPAFPADICPVVFQGSERQTGCQFTFSCDGSLARVPSSPALTRSRAIAEAALSGAVDARVGLATHYHADYVVPRWRDGLVKIAQQGAHLFYRWPGYWGTSAAMSRKSNLGHEPVIAALAALSPAHAPSVATDLVLPEMNVKPVPLAPVKIASTGLAPLQMQLDPAAMPGSYALKALALCGSAPNCRVAGMLAQEIAFVYIRKGGVQGEGAYWDCTKFQRNDRAQCLPGGQALDRLLAG